MPTAAGADGPFMGSGDWWRRLETRWAERRAALEAADPPLHRDVRVTTFATRDIAAPRAEVWATSVLHEEQGHHDGWCHHIVGAPVSGIGAKHLNLGPPAPPDGLRTVMFTEVIASQQDHWYTLQTHAGAWVHEETFQFLDAPDGGTTVQIHGWHRRPLYRGSLAALQSTLSQLAHDALVELTERVERPT